MAPALTPTMACSGTPCLTSCRRTPAWAAPRRPPALSTTPIRTAGQLAELVRSCVPRSKVERIDPATRTFQALRIAVNDELKSLEIALRRLPDCLRPGGRLAVISFHSLEDRRVKEAFRDDARLTALMRKPITPDQRELDLNPRSRSAKLRVAERRQN